MSNLLSIIIFILFLKNYEKNEALFLKKVKGYPNDIFIGWCFISKKFEGQISCDKNFYEPVPKRWIKVEVKNANKIITTYYPKNILKVKTTPLFAFEKKDIILLLPLLFLFIILLNRLFKKKSLQLPKILQPDLAQDFSLKKTMKSKNNLKVKLKNSTKFFHPLLN